MVEEKKSRKSNNEKQRQLARRLEETGEKERLKQRLRAKLIECGWRDEIKDLAKEVIKNRGGVSKITLEDLVSELLARGSIPESVELELVAHIRDFARRDAFRSFQTSPQPINEF